ncbi:MAG: hypothetical protein RLZZ524_3 [Pseudomonadota bacterium]|jgi:hypothetical protein
MFDPATLSADAAACIEALADATLTWSPADGSAALSAPVLHDAETGQMLGILSQGHVVRYASAALPGLAEGEVVAIGSDTYRVAEVRALGDGRTAAAVLHRYTAAS